MLIYDMNGEKLGDYYLYKYLEIKKEINELDIIYFEIPKKYRNYFKAEFEIFEENQSYTVKNIEPIQSGYKIECKQNVDEWLSFFHKSVNFPYKDIETMIKAIIPNGWSYKIIGEIKKYRTITADHKSSWEVFEEIVKKFDVEYRINNKEKRLLISEKIGEDKGVFFSDDFNIDDKDISVESFEFATRIIPEGMNGLKINQINDGKDYLENKSYSGKTINYYWKDERYTNIQNLKDEAAKKLEVLSRPRITIKLKVKDLSKAIGVYEQEYSIGDYVYLIDTDRKTKERFRVLAETFFPNKPFNNEIFLANKPLDLLDDVDENIELTKEMWEETRGRFEATEELIKGYLENSKKYTDDSFKTYKSEREQTDSKIYESITESTTYIDPETGQTQPIIDKQLEIIKSVDGIKINVKNNADNLNKKISKDDILEDEEIQEALKGKDGVNGMPGEPGADGKTSYMHFAYADSSDGTVGFVLTATEGKKYIGFYTDFEKKDSKDPKKYEWSKYVGDDGKPGKDGQDGIPGKAGADGKDGKTGKIGQNLLRNSNIEIESSDFRVFAIPLCETPDNGETMTFTAKIKVEKDDSIGLFNSGGMINLTDWIEIKKADDYQIISTTFKWVDRNTDQYVQYNPPVLYAYIDSNRNNTKANKVMLEWAVLTRGDIPAIEWSPCYADVDDAISEKASEESLQDLQIHFAMYPTAEELNQNKVDLIKQQAYLDQLKTAIDSNALSLEDRLSIIEANVGAGKVSLEAINTYLHFGEEGVLIGKEGEQVRLRLINNALEITDGTKVVARFANNQTETPNLKVSGAFEFGYHVANKVDLDGDKYTVISANI